MTARPDSLAAIRDHLIIVANNPASHGGLEGLRRFMREAADRIATLEAAPHGVNLMRKVALRRTFQSDADFQREQDHVDGWNKAVAYIEAAPAGRAVDEARLLDLAENFMWHTSDACQRVNALEMLLSKVRAEIMQYAVDEIQAWDTLALTRKIDAALAAAPNAPAAPDEPLTRNEQERESLREAIASRPTVRGETPLFCAKLDEAPAPVDPHCAYHQPGQFDIDCIDCSDALERQRKAEPAGITPAVVEGDTEFWAERLEMLGDLHSCGGGTMKACATMLRDHATLLAARDELAGVQKAMLSDANDLSHKMYLRAQAAEQHVEALEGLLRKLYDTAAKGFHVSESGGGPDGHYVHISKFQTLVDLQAYENAWRAVMISARDALLPEAGTGSEHRG